MSADTQHDVVELVDLADAENRTAPHEGTEQRLVQSLPPYDGGTAAWTILISAFVFEALLWGMSSKNSILNTSRLKSVRLNSDCETRFSTLFRSLPKLLQPTPSIRFESLYFHNRNLGLRSILHRCPSYHSFDQALHEISQAHDLHWL